MKKITEYFTVEEIFNFDVLAKQLKNKYFEKEDVLNSSLLMCFLLLISCASLRNLWNHSTELRRLVTRNICRCTFGKR